MAGDKFSFSIVSAVGYSSLVVYVPFVLLLFKFRRHSVLGSSFFHLMLSNGIADICMLANLAVMGMIIPSLTCEQLSISTVLWGNAPIIAYSAFQTVSTIHILLLTWNRYDAIANPVQFQKGKWKGHFTHGCIAASWLIGAGSYAPYLFAPYEVRQAEDGEGCVIGLKEGFQFAMRILRLTRIILQLFTAITLVVFYGKMCQKLRTSMINLKVDRATRRLTLIGALLAAPLFLMCCLNTAVIIFLLTTGDIFPLWDYLKMPIFTTLYVLICENPFVVWMVCEEFRVETRRLLGLNAKTMALVSIGSQNNNKVGSFNNLQRIDDSETAKPKSTKHSVPMVHRHAK